METKLLDLNAYGVEEMSVAEMREIDGGFWPLVWKAVKWVCKWAIGVAAGGLTYEIATNPGDAADAWAAGRERAMQ